MGTFVTHFEASSNFVITELSRSGGYNDCSTSLMSIKIEGNGILDMPTLFSYTPKGGYAVIQVDSPGNKSFLIDENYNENDNSTQVRMKYLETDPYDPSVDIQQSFPFKLYCEGELTLHITVNCSNYGRNSSGELVIGACMAYPDAVDSYSTANLGLTFKSGGISLGEFNLQDNQDYYYINS